MPLPQPSPTLPVDQAVAFALRGQIGHPAPDGVAGIAEFRRRALDFDPAGDDALMRAEQRAREHEGAGAEEAVHPDHLAGVLRADVGTE